MAHIVLKNIVKLYDDRHPVIHGIDLDIRDGEFVVFVGPSGCGKSTLLRMIAGLEDITGGELHIGGKLANDIAPAERGLAMVFQSYALYPHMTVFENMAFALTLAGHKKAEVRAAVERAADILQIAPLLQRNPRTCRAASASAWPSAAPSCASPRSSCSTSRCRTWTPRCACRCAWKSRACTRN